MQFSLVTMGGVAPLQFIRTRTRSVTTRTQANLPASTELTLGQEALGKTRDSPDWASYRFPEHNTMHETLENEANCTYTFLGWGFLTPSLIPDLELKNPVSVPKVIELCLPRAPDLKIFS